MTTPVISTTQDAPPAVPRRPAHPALAGLASGLLLYFAYPPADRGYLGLVRACAAPDAPET